MLSTPHSRAHEGNGRIRIMLVEDNSAFLECALSLIQREPTLHVVATASDGCRALQYARELAPDLAVLDIGLPDISGIEVARRIRQFSPQTKIVILTQDCSPDLVEEAFNAGASGYVSKMAAGSNLIHAITHACSGILPETA